MCPLQRIGKVCLISSALCHPVSCLCHIRFFVLSCCFKYLCLIVFLLSVQIRSDFFCTLFYLYLCFSTFFCVCGVCEAVCVQTGVFRGPCGPLTWLGVQQESWSSSTEELMESWAQSWFLLSPVIGFGLGGKMATSERLWSLGVNETCGSRAEHTTPRKYAYTQTHIGIVCVWYTCPLIQISQKSSALMCFKIIL